MSQLLSHLLQRNHLDCRSFAWCWRANRSLLIGFLMVSLAPVSEAKDFVQRNGKMTLVLRTPGKDRSLALSDLLAVTLTLEGDAPIAVDAPLDLPADSAWQLVSRTRPTRETIDARRERWRIAYQFAPREPGRLAFVFPDVRTGADHAVSWQAESFEVTTSVTDADNAAVDDITGIEELPAVQTARITVTWMLACVALLALAVVLIFARHRTRTTRRLASEFALYELSRLEAMKSSATGQEAARLILLTAIVRRYLDRAISLPVRRQTTPELLATLQNTPLLNDDEKQFLSRFFQAMDTVRYAGVAATEDQFREWTSSVRAFLVNRSEQVDSASQRRT